MKKKTRNEGELAGVMAHEIAHVALRHGSIQFFFFSSRRRHTRCGRDWSSDVCSSDLPRRLGNLGVRDVAVPCRYALGAGQHARGGPGRRGQRGPGVLACGPAGDPPGRAQCRGHPRPRLAEDLRSFVRLGPAQPEDRRAVGVHVVHHVRRRFLQPGRDDRNTAADRRRPRHRALHLVRHTEGAAVSAVGVSRARAPAALTATQPRPRRSRARRWPKIVQYGTLYALACLFLLPVYVLVVTALKNPAEVTVTGMWHLPDSVSLDSFRIVWPKLESGLRNSIVLAVPASLISSLLGCANGFVLSKWRFRGA